MAVDESSKNYSHPLYDVIEHMPGVSVALTQIDKVLTWGSSNALWVFPMATSCCGIEFMAASASRFDLDRIGTIPRGTPPVRCHGGRRDHHGQDGPSREKALGPDA